MKKITLILVFCLLYGCQPLNVKYADMNRLSKYPVSSLKSTGIKGYYVLAAGINEFMPCGSDKRYKLILPEDSIGLLNNSYSDLASNPNEKILIYLDGSYFSEESNEFGESYSGGVLDKKNYQYAEQPFL